MVDLREIWIIGCASVGVALAGKGLLVAWFRSPLLERWRPVLEDWRDSECLSDRSWADSAKWFAGYVLTCSVCLGFHVIFWLAAAAWLQGLLPFGFIVPVALIARGIELVLPDPVNESDKPYQSDKQ